ncbi:MAG: M48 family metalloprotease [Acidilobaceae archaeon]
MILELLFAQWWILIIEALALAGVVALLALSADRIVGDAPRSLLSLRFSMGLTLIFMISAYVGLMILAGRLLGYGSESLVIVATVMAFLLVALQWLISPFLINLAYHTRPPANAEEQFYASEAARLAKLSGMSPPKFVIAEVDFPNAFAYGSPISGNYVAVTRGLLRSMTREEVIAVIGHEVGHLKNRDVTWILALSIIPIAVFFIGRALIYAGVLGGSSERRANPVYLIAIGAVFVAAGVLFQFLIAHFNRLREYYVYGRLCHRDGQPQGPPEGSHQAPPHILEQREG